MRQTIQILSELLFIVVLSTAHSAAFAADPMVYLPLGNANKVGVIDAAHDRLLATIPGIMNAHGLASTPDGQFLVVASLTERPVGAPVPKPSQMKEQEHLSHHDAPASKTPSSGKQSIIYLIDTKERRVINQIEVPGASHHVAVTPDGRYAIATNPGLGGVSVVDLKQRKLLHEIATGPVPNYALVSRDGRHVYVSNTGNSTVSVIDTSHWIVSRNMLVGKTPEHMVLSPDGRTLYVVNVAPGKVSAVDLSNGQITHTYRIGPDAHGIALADDGMTLFATSRDANRLVSVDLASGREHILKLAPAPYHVAAIPGADKLYVSSRRKPLIWVVMQNPLSVKDKIHIQGVGHQMAVVTK